ncbi:hypothetical protein L6172_13150 [Thalassospiraceae bacterium SW-3-3]|nr:hypothetical protein L6172_13150 [Thalassospiraceae bacterium SW-3-3]
MNWPIWNKIFADKPALFHSTERWFLRYFHSEEALRDLIEVSLLQGVQNAEKIDVQSVWIDGTPQARGVTETGQKVRCELADLLLIIQVFGPSGKHSSRRGILLQGKVGKVLPKFGSDKSTQKERDLLETLDRSKDLSLFRGGLRSRLLNTNSVYRMTNVPLWDGPTKATPAVGLEDCSSYLFFAPGGIQTEWYYCPFLMGWPENRDSKGIGSATDFRTVVERTYKDKLFGRKILGPNEPYECEWSRLVWDLLGTYKDAVINSIYGKFPRINQVSKLLSFQCHEYDLRTRNISFMKVPPKDAEAVEVNPPNISVVLVNVKLSKEPIDDIERPD